MQTQPKTIFTTVLLTMAWIAAVSLGLRTLLSYESAPGQVGTVPHDWPSASKIERASDRMTLIMLAHPHCPCTRASINELAQIMAQIQGKVRAHVLFLKPQDSDSSWDDTDLRRSAAAIPGVTVSSDVDGTEARLFGAETSGHALLFDSAGRRLFSGGITGSRGHSGDNVGESAIVALVNDHAAARTSTLVFGCALLDRHQPEKGASASCPN